VSHRAFDDNPASHSFGVVSEEEEAALRAAAGDVSGGVDELPDEHARSLLLDFSADLLAVTGFDGRVRWANPAHELVLGLDPKGLAGHTYQELLHPDDASSATEALERVATAGTVASFEARLRTVDGSFRWFQFSARAHAGLELIYSIGRDVTERRRAEDELALAHDLALAVAGADSAERAIEMVLRGVCERTGWAIGQAWVLSPDGRTLVCSPAWHAGTAGLSSFRRVTEALSFVPGIGLPGKAWESARAVWIRDVRSDPGFERGLFAQAVGLAGGVAVPVMAEEEVVAVIEFFVFEQREEDERLVALVSAVAAQVGTLIGRKHAEEELRLSEKHFRAVAESAADAIVSVDEQDKVAYVNAAAERIFGRPAEDVVGGPLEQLLDKPAPRLEDGGRAVVSTTGRGRDGEEIPLEAAFSRWSEGEDRFTTAVLRDVTDRRRADAIVQEAEERFRGAFEHAPIGMALVSIEHDRAGCFLRVNRALCELIGRSADELVGRELAEIVVPGEGSDTDARYVPWMLAGEVPGYEVEQRLVRADGEVLMSLVSVSLVRDAQERPLYLIVQVQDVTARKRAEAALHESRERVQAIIDNTPAVISVKDGEGRYTLVNRSFEQVFGIDRERAAGRSDEELFPGELAPAMRANDLRVMREHVPLQVEEAIEHPDGPHTYLSAKFPLRDESGRSYAVCAIATDITERKRAEQALRESEQHFRRIVDTAHDAFVSLDESGRITAWNPQAEETFGWTEAEAVGRSFAETVIPARQRSTHTGALRRFMETGKASLFDRRLELDVVRRDGREFVVEMTMTAVRAGGRYAFNAFLHDITERKQAEETLRRLADIVQSSHDAIIATSAAGEITSWNPGAGDLYGYRAEEVTGQPLEMLIPAERVQDDGRMLSQALAGRRLEDFETEHRRKDGSIVPVSVTVSAMRDSRRAIVGASVIVRDRTERKRAEDAMREVQEAFRRAFEDAPIGVALFGVEAEERGRLLQVNHSMSQITGYSGRELLSMSLEEITHPHDADLERPLYDQLMSAEIPNYQLEKRYLRGDGGTVWVMHNASIAHDSSGRLLYGIAQVQDITRRKQTEDRLASVASELERRASELERSNSDLQEFAYVASHDLSEPLRMVASYTQLLARRYQGRLDSDADEFIGFAVDGVNRMQRLIDDLLAYSRAGTSEYRFGPVDVAELVRDTLVGMQTTVAESGATVVAGELPTVWGDEGQLRQLFQNLIGNGIKFRADDPPRVEVTAERQGNAWLFRVSDNGIGIDPRHVERIFSVFKRLHGRDEYPGSGIGLSICKRIVERHHGRISVERGPAGGSSFCFTIPDREQRRPGDSRGEDEAV
jgi:PAS domain S-box-containing protein